MVQSHGSAAPLLEPGVRVKVVGYSDERSHLNHRAGTVEEYDAYSFRWRVLLDTGDKKLFKNTNLQMISREEEDEEEEAMPVELSNKPSLMTWQDEIEKRLVGLEMQLGKILHGMNEQKVLVNDLSFLQVSTETAISKLQAQASEAAESISRSTFAEAQLGRFMEFRLQIALAAAEANPEHPTCWSGLEDAIKDAKMAGVDSQQVQMGEQACRRSRELRLQIALAAAETNPEHLTCWSELENAIKVAKAADVDSQRVQMAEQVYMRRWELRLQTALAATETNPEHPTCWSELEDAIKDAEVVDVDSQLFQMAEQACMRRRELRLQTALAAAETNPEHPTRWSELEDAIKVAKAAGVDSQQVQMAKQACMRRSAEAALENISSFEELYRAMPAATEAGVPEVKLRSIEARISSQVDQKEKISQAQRKLRIAVSWASPQNVAKLQSAISEAEEAGVDKEEIAKAALKLSTYKQQAAQNPVSLRSVLNEAKPTWGEKVLDAAVDKLNAVGIFDIQRLAAELSADAPFQSSLNELLKNGGQRTFTEETLTSLVSVLSKHDLSVDLPAATS